MRRLVLGFLAAQFAVGAAIAVETLGRTIKGLESRTAGRALEIVRELEASGAIEVREGAEDHWRVASAFKRAAQEEARGYASRVYWASFALMGFAVVGAGLVIAGPARRREGGRRG